MPAPPTGRGIALCGLAVLVAALTGCSGGCNSSSGPVVTKISPAEQHVCNIAQAYRAVFEETGKAPESYDDIRGTLKVFGNPDEFRVSPNDGQPYVVMWGADPTRGGAGSVKGMWAIVVHEQTGAGGVRAVADIRGLATTVTDEEFGKLSFIRKGKSEKSDRQKGK